MAEQFSSPPPTSEDETILQRPPVGRLLGQTARKVPWWMVLLVLMFIVAGMQLTQSKEYQDIFYAMIDRPVWNTEDKFDVVYTVDTEVLILSHAFTLRSDDDRMEISSDQVVSVEEGTVQCNRDVDPDCIDQFGEVVTYRAPLLNTEGLEPDGTTEIRGLLQPGVLSVVAFPDGTSMVVDPETILSREEGTLTCNRILQADCEDLTGEIVTVAQPYMLRQGLLLREDILIRHSDGFEQTVRPSRLSDIEDVPCDAETEAVCHDGTYTRALFQERIVGTEVGREDGQIQVRTVDEQTEFIPHDAIISITEGEIACDQDANPRCEDFTGVAVERRGAIVEGELTLENNRALNIIPTGETTSIEVFKSDIVTDERTPENCRVEDEGACLIRIQEKDTIVQGVILEETDAGLTIQTVAPTYVELDSDHAEATRRAPLVCAANNIRGCNAGIWLTLLVTGVAYSLAMIVGLIVGLMRVSSNPILYHVSTLYVELVRGTPLLVLLLFFAFVIGPTIRDMEPINLILFDLKPGAFYDFLNSIEVAILGEESFLSEAVLGLAIGYAAFLAEVFRAGIQSIGKGQMEAARSLGMNYPQAMRHVILPQAIRVVLPPLGNDFIALLKDSALISVLALPDLLQNGRLYVTRTFQPIPVYVTVALLYILLTLILSMLVRYIERRFELPSN